MHSVWPPSFACRSLDLSRTCCYSCSRVLRHRFVVTWKDQGVTDLVLPCHALRRFGKNLEGVSAVRTCSCARVTLLLQHKQMRKEPDYFLSLRVESENETRLSVFPLCDTKVATPTLYYYLNISHIDLSPSVIICVLQTSCFITMYLERKYESLPYILKQGAWGLLEIQVCVLQMQNIFTLCWVQHLCSLQNRLCLEKIKATQLVTPNLRTVLVFLLPQSCTPESYSESHRWKE